MKKRPFEPDIDRAEFEPKLPRALRSGKRGVLAQLKRMSKPKTVRKAKARRLKGRGGVKAPRLFNQRVIVKARVVKGALGKNTARHRALLHYLNKNGAGLGGERAELYNETGRIPREELSQTVKKWSEDPHHFRFIISPKNGDELELESYIKRLMETVSKDLGTKLEWHAANHYDTDEPHSHVVVRGIDEYGKPLLISKDYISHGFRQAAEREATIRLGTRTANEFQKDIENALIQERYTPLDGTLEQLQNASEEKNIKLGSFTEERSEWERKIRTQKIKRLVFLESKGLAQEVKPGVWKVSESLKVVLAEIAHKRQIETLIAPHLKDKEERKQQLVIHRESDVFKPTLNGIVLAKDFSNELYEKKYILLSADDGRTHFIPLNRFSEPQGFECKIGQVVSVKPPSTSGIKSEEVIYRYLGERGGIFSLDGFASHVQSQIALKKWVLPEQLIFDEYINLFATRCETLTKDGILKEESPKRWIVPEDLLQKIEELEKIQNKKHRVQVSLLTISTLKEQAYIEGATWLDKLFKDKSMIFNASGCFRLRVEAELERRKQELNKRKILVHAQTFERLLKADEKKLIYRLSKRLGKAQKLNVGEQITGRVIAYEQLGERYQMVVKTETSFFSKYVGVRESQLPFNTEVELTKEVRIYGSKRREFVRVRTLDKTRNQEQQKTKI